MSMTNSRPLRSVITRVAAGADAKGVADARPVAIETLAKHCLTRQSTYLRLDYRAVTLCRH